MNQGRSPDATPGRGPKGWRVAAVVAVAAPAQCWPSARLSLLFFHVDGGDMGKKDHYDTL